MSAFGLSFRTSDSLNYISSQELLTWALKIMCPFNVRGPDEPAQYYNLVGLVLYINAGWTPWDNENSSLVQKIGYF